MKIYSQEKLATVSNIKLITEGFSSVNRFNAFHTLFYIPEDKQQSDSEAVQARLTCIRKNNYIFSFFAASSMSDYSQYQPEVNSIISSFKTLTNRKHLSRLPQRIRVKSTSRKERLSDFLLRHGIDKKKWPVIAMINSLNLSQLLTPNQLIKIIY